MSARVSTIDPDSVAALLFDLGNVVIDTDFERVLRVWADLSAAPIEQIREGFQQDEAYARHERGELDFCGYCDHLRERLGVDLSDDQLFAGWNAIYVGETPGAAALLAHVSTRRPAYAFTNTNPAHQQVWQVEFADLLGHFREVYVSSDLGLRKPEPAAYRLVAGRMGCAPEGVLFLDDVVENIEGALAVGMQAVLVRSFDDVRVALAGI